MRNVKTQIYIFCVFTLVAFLNLIYQAINVPLTHDEIATFHQYVQRAQFIPFFSEADGNNHFLNSFFIYLFYKLFGYSSIIIRMPNLIMFLVYCLFVWKISTELKSNWLRTILWIGFLFSLHFIEFFALARGYGMGYSFLLAGLWFHLQAEKSKNIRHYYYCFILLALACLSLLTLTFNLVLLSFWFITRELVKSVFTRNEFKRLLFSLVLPALFVLVLLSFKIRATGGYIEGSKGDFLEVSLSSLFRVLFDLNFIEADKLAYSILAVIIIVNAVLIIVILRSKDKLSELFDPHLIFVYLLVGNVVLTFATNYLFGLNFPETRMAVYFYPLMLLSLIFTFEYLSNKKVHYLNWILIPIIYLPFHFSTHLFSNFSVWYKYCHIPERFYDKVMNEYKPESLPPTIAGHGTQAYAWSALVKENNGKANLMETSSFPFNITDYQIIEIKYFPNWRENYDTIDYDEISNLHLLKRKNQTSFRKILEIKHLGTPLSTKQEHLVFCDTIVHNWQGKIIRLDYDFSIETRKPLIGMVVCSVEDSVHNNLMFNTIQFNLLSETWEGTDHNFIKSMLFKLPDKARHMSILIWNLEKTPYNLKTGEITLSVM